MSGTALPGRLAVGVALAVAAAGAWWAVRPAERAIVALAERQGSAPASPLSAARPMPASFDRQAPDPSGITRPLPSAAAPAPAAARAVAIISVAAPQRLPVGEQTELVIGLGANAGVAEISMTVRFDPNVLQARTAIEGNRAAGAATESRFLVDISDAGDRVQIRSAVSGQRLADAGGTAAVVSFQAVGAGATSVMVSDLTVKDLAGNAVPFSLSASNLQITAESQPPPAPVTAQPRTVLSAE